MAIKVYVNDNGTPTLVEMAAESAEALAKLVSAAQAQDFTDEEKAQARSNINALGVGEVDFSGLVKSINGEKPDASGAVDLSSLFLMLAGGTMTGVINFSLTDVIKRTVDDEWLTIVGGTGSDSSYLQLFGKNSSSDVGNGFVICARNGTNTISLRGNAEGALQWGAENVERLHSSTVANSGYDNCVKYASGLMIQTGSFVGVANVSKNVTFTEPFKNYPSVILSNEDASSCGGVPCVLNTSSTGFTSGMNWPSTNGNTNTIRKTWIAIGRWE